MIQLPFIALIMFALAILVPTHMSDPAFNDYVKEYLTIVNKVCLPQQLNYKEQTKIYFVQKFDDPQEAAQCTRYDNGSWEIEVLQSEWDKITMDNRRSLIYHELSHCILLKPHVANAQNYMYPSIVDVEYDIVNDQVLGDAYATCVVNGNAGDSGDSAE